MLPVDSKLDPLGDRQEVLVRSADRIYASRTSSTPRYYDEFKLIEFDISLKSMPKTGRRVPVDGVTRQQKTDLGASFRDRPFAFWLL